MSLAVITDGDIGLPAAVLPADVVFTPVLPFSITVSSSTVLGVDGNPAALESDIDASMAAAFVGLAGVGSDLSIGTSSYGAITSITLSSVLKKSGTFVVVKVTVGFTMVPDTQWIIPPPPPGGTPSEIYKTTYDIPCTLSWTTVQTKLTAA